jgi:HK97 family phage major capsid protein
MAQAATLPPVSPQDLETRMHELYLGQKALVQELEEGRAPYRAKSIVHKDYRQQSLAQNNGGFGSIGEYLIDVRKHQLNQGTSTKMKTWFNQWTKATPPGMNETTATDGGVLIPPQFISQLLMRTYDNDLLARTRLFPMSSNILRIPAVDETSRADGSRFGGIRAYWKGEGPPAMPYSKPGLSEVKIELSTLTLLIRVTNELLEDASALEVYVNDMSAQELNFKLGDGIVNGDGVEKPFGIMQSPARVAVPKESGQAAATVVSQNIVKMWSRMFAPCRDNAVWLINQDVEPQLFTMTIGTAGANLAVYLPPGGLSSSPYATLMGRPVLPVEFCNTVGTEGDIILADLSQYLTGTRNGIQSLASAHVFFDTNEFAYRFTLRMDGRPWWKTPLTPFKGTNTKSCFVTLATRS